VLPRTTKMTRFTLFVALAAALIWLGLERGGPVEAGFDEAVPPTSEVLDGAPRVSEGAEDAPPQTPVNPPPDADGRAPDQADGARSTTVPAQDLDLGGAARGSGTASRPTPSPGLRQDPPEVLARHLIASWVAADPSALEGYIRGETGAGVPDARRQLVASFWQACMGQHERAAAQLQRLDGAEGTTPELIALLRAALEPAGGRRVPAVSVSREPLARAMRMVLLDDEGRIALQRSEHRRAAELLSDLVLSELGAPWDPQRTALLAWGDLLRQAQEKHRLAAAGDWAGVQYVVRPGDGLLTVRQRVLADDPSLLFNTGLVARINGVRDDRLRVGEVLRIPKEHPNALVDLDARVVVYRIGGEAVLLWEVGIGREGHDTPVGTYSIGEKLPQPSHMPEGGRSLPYGHPDNPLGTRWMAWNRDQRNTSFGFHGTPDPASVGGRVSEGCVRMRNEDVEELYELLPRDARVIVQP